MSCRFLLPLLLTCALVPFRANAQFEPARVDNPSFEGEPADATTPASWHPCAPGTTPDILPGPWAVTNEPHDGDTYVGLITRPDGSYESIGQRLSRPLKKGECYTIRLALAHSPTYYGYHGPLKLRIYGGTRKCRLDQLLAESPRIEHADFRVYEFEFRPKKDLYYLILEAFHQEGRFSYMGNILIDDVQPIRVCPRAFRQMK